MRWLERLISILDRERKLIEEMILLLERERKAIVDGDMDGLLSIAKEKETLGTKHKMLEEARALCLKNAGKEGRTVSQLMEELAPHEASRLKEAVEGLKAAVERLGWENKRNLLLINKAMELNSELLRIFSPLYSLSYRPDGTLNTDFNGGLQIRG